MGVRVGVGVGWYGGWAVWCGQELMILDVAENREREGINSVYRIIFFII